MATEVAANKAIIVLRNIIVLRKIDCFQQLDSSGGEIVSASGEVDRPVAELSINSDLDSAGSGTRLKCVVAALEAADHHADFHASAATHKREARR
jgi:hypothetical protein